MLSRLDALAVGLAAWRLGAGRARKEDPVQAGAGVVLHAKPGDAVAKGEPLMTLLTDETDRFARAEESLRGGYDIDTRPARSLSARSSSTASPDVAAQMRLPVARLSSHLRRWKASATAVVQPASR